MCLGDTLSNPTHSSACSAWCLGAVGAARGAWWVHYVQCVVPGCSVWCVVGALGAVRGAW